MLTSNRVETIIQNKSPEFRYEISSQENPSVLGSRGHFPGEIVDSSIWWCGPTFILSSLIEWLPVKLKNISGKQLHECKTKRLFKYPYMRQHVFKSFNEI